ncbi:MAG: copper chaperone PCu(A)C [Gammaproteobacteria bacterium]|nr:copper chaperone PCu(A)C [Gammaproteobacteria bacterium]
MLKKFLHNTWRYVTTIHSTRRNGPLKQRMMALTKIFPLVLLLMMTTINAADKLHVHDAWAREAPPKTSVIAAYLTLQNPSPSMYTLTGLSSPDFKRIEMHRTEQHDGMSKMLPVPQVILNSKGHIVFRPGGMHLMLINPKKRLKAGDNITLTLFFTDEHSTNSSLEISLPVKKATANTLHNGQHDSHSHQH